MTYQYNNIRRHKSEFSERHPGLLPSTEVLHLDGVSVAGQPEGAERLTSLLVLQTEQTLQILRRGLLSCQVFA